MMIEKLLSLAPPFSCNGSSLCRFVDTATIERNEKIILPGGFGLSEFLSYSIATMLVYGEVG